MFLKINDTGETVFRTKKISCIIGKKGLTSDKKEGDNRTPEGILRPLAVFYRAGRTVRPIVAGLPVYPLYPRDGWCDDIKDTHYNHYVRLPYRARTEKLYREDGVYDLLLIGDYNYPDAKRGKGSAIFIHLQRPDKAGTEGCLAFEYKRLKRILRHLKPGDYFEISGNAADRLKMRLSDRFRIKKFFQPRRFIRKF